MTTDLKGRYADYFRGDKAAKRIDYTSRLSLNAVKVGYGMDIARELLTRKTFTLSNERWLELILIPGEESKDEVAKKEIVLALYLDLKESYPTFTYEWLLAEADRLLTGGQPSGGPSILLNRYLEEMSL